MTKEITDFHAHPFFDAAHNFCYYKNSLPSDANSCAEYLQELGITRICGSILEVTDDWERIKACNREALALTDVLGEFYVPGFHIHPDNLRESIAELDLMGERGLKLVGELVPYMHGWDFSHPNLPVLLKVMEDKGMILNFHSTNISDDVMMPLLKGFPDLTFVAAHPGEKPSVESHLRRMEQFDNYYLDLSGGGLGRQGVLKYMIDRAGKERFLFGTDFPICPPAMYISVIDHEPFMTVDEKEHVFYKNAERLLFGGAT